MEKAVFEATEGGRGLKFPVSGQGETNWIIVPRELLDDEVGDSASADERQTWVENNLDAILNAYEKKLSGGVIVSPFDRIAVRRSE